MTIAQDFSLMIEEQALDKNMNLMETAIEIADDKGLSFQELVPFLSPLLREKIKQEAIYQGYKIE